MNLEKIEDYVNQYFKYVKAVFIREYSKYLSPETVLKIQNMENVFIIDLDRKFKISLSEKIMLCLNIKDYIIENNLVTDGNLKDISIDGKIYVKYLLDNQNNLEKLVLEIILKPILLYFIENENSVITNGTIDEIIEEFEKKYNIIYKKPFKSKEQEVADKIKNIVGNDIFYKAVLNNNFDLLEKYYNMNVESEIEINPFKKLNKELNKEYENYYKRKGKVYLSDSLYDYENLNYNFLIEKINRISNTRISKNDVIKNRLISAKNSVESLLSHRILFENKEQINLKNCLIEIEILISELNVISINKIVEKLLEIENKLFVLTERLWQKQLTHPYNYNEGGHFNFLIGKKDECKIKETILINNSLIKKVDIKNGIYYIYQMRDGSLVYASSKDFLINTVVPIKENNELIFSNNEYYEIDNQQDSRLITIEVLTKDIIKNNSYYGKVILNENSRVNAILVIYDNDYDINIEKAKLRSEEFALPLIKIDKKKYGKQEIEIKPKKEIIENKINNNSKIVLKKESLAKKIEKLKNKLFYE